MTGEEEWPAVPTPSSPRSTTGRILQKILSYYHSLIMESIKCDSIDCKLAVLDIFRMFELLVVRRGNI